MKFHREVERGCDGLEPAAELEFGIEYCVEFPGGEVRRIQAVMCQTDFVSLPIDGNRRAARETLEHRVSDVAERSYESADDLDRELSVRGFRLAIDTPAHKYKLWQRIVRTVKPEPQGFHRGAISIVIVGAATLGLAWHDEPHPVEPKPGAAQATDVGGYIQSGVSAASDGHGAE